VLLWRYDAEMGIANSLHSLANMAIIMKGLVLVIYYTIIF